jgi:hypothetical protein
MFKGVGAYETHITPGDQDVVAAQKQFITSAKTALRFSIYGATLQEFFDSVIQMDNAGLDCMGLFDHTQSAGPKEHELVTEFYKRVKNPANYLIGTSPDAHQILHLKGIWINHSSLTPYAGAPQQFDTWEDAAAAGYPCTWSGSWNFSDSASSQFNNVDLLPGTDRAQGFNDAWDKIFAWVKANEQQYQVVTAALAT